MSNGIFFLHNPKAGGTAVAGVLSGMFQPCQCCPLIENTEREHRERGGRYAGHRGYRYYGGHYGRDIFDQVAAEHVAVTNFRDPVERIRSLHAYFRHHVVLPQDDRALDNLYPVVFAQQVDIAGFVSTDDPRIEIHTRNHHARQLTGSGWVADDEVDIDEACRFVETMPWYYVCEHPTLSGRWGRAAFGPAFGSIPRANATSARLGSVPEPLDAATRRLILDKNRHDIVIYRRATLRLLG